MPSASHGSPGICAMARRCSVSVAVVALLLSAPTASRAQQFTEVAIGIAPLIHDGTEYHGELTVRGSIGRALDANWSLRMDVAYVSAQRRVPAPPVPCPSQGCFGPLYTWQLAEMTSLTVAAMFHSRGARGAYVASRLGGLRSTCSLKSTISTGSAKGQGQVACSLPW